MSVSLREFLLARIAEDEEDVWSFRDSGEPGYWTWQRMLAECEAKRRIVSLYRGSTGANYSQRRGERIVALMAMRALALPYADHPDYDTDWQL